jgi:IS5 family transposase
MLPRAVKKRIRPVWIAALASAAWMNRQDLARWAKFAKRAVEERHGRPVSEVMTEARVRAAVSADPVLRRDPALADVRVDHGVVTLLTTTPTWPDNHGHLARLRKVKGIADVTARPAEASMAGAFA